MASSRAVPVVVGVGDVKNKSTTPTEPMQLMVDAIQQAIADAKLSAGSSEELRRNIDSMDVVGTWSWPYADLPGLIAQKLAIEPQHKYCTPHGGNWPAKLFDHAARKISQRQINVAVVTGGEALASLAQCVKAGQMPPPGWTKVEQDIAEVFSPTTRALPDNLGGIHDLGAPVQLYPLYENAFRAARRQTIADNDKESAALYAEFAKVAEQNEISWSYGQPSQTEESIKTVSKKNRMICFPYRLLMNAFNEVNLAAACILTSTEYARQLGIPEDRWIYPLGGAGTQDASNVWERPNFYTSPSISKSLDVGIEVSGLSKQQIDLYDFYSCFPIVPKLACQHLSLPITKNPKPLTVLGGLTSFGGAGNNYSLHAITAMVREIRKGNGHNGLVLANGGWVSYQHVVCISSRPRQDGTPYPDSDKLPEVLEYPFVPDIDDQAEGEAEIETYTVDFGRDGSPQRGHVVGRLKGSGNRFLANHGNIEALKELSRMDEEQVGKTVWVTRDSKQPKRNIFIFRRNSKL